MKRSLAILALLALTACQPQDPTGAPAPPPADAPVATGAPVMVSDFSQPMTAVGAEPFWSVKVDGTRFTLSRPGEPDMVAEAPGASIKPGQAQWVARAADGRSLAVTFYVSACSDGMSERAYPMTAEVTLDGSAAMYGRAIKSAEMAPERGSTADP